MSQYVNSYRKVMAERIATAKPETLMVMLYEGAVTRIKQAKERFGAEQKFPARESVLRAMRIVDALMEHLNLETGGETAQNLERLFLYVVSELSTAARSEQAPDDSLDNALLVLEPLCASWRELAAREGA